MMAPLPPPTRSHRTVGPRTHRTLTLAAAALSVTAWASLLSGCSTFGQLIGGMAASAERTGSHDVAAKYNGIAGKSFVVVVAADRSVQSDFPSVVGDITITVAEEIRKNAGPSGWVPPQAVLRYQYQHPGWTSMPLDKLAQEFGAKRLVYIDLREYRLNDPGNAYLWAGVASGTVSVVEADGPLSDQFIIAEPIQVEFPGKSGLGPQQIPRETVQSALSRRFCDKASWLFYDHEEANHPE